MPRFGYFVAKINMEGLGIQAMPKRHSDRSHVPSRLMIVVFASAWCFLIDRKRRGPDEWLRADCSGEVGFGVSEVRSSA